MVNTFKTRAEICIYLAKLSKKALIAQAIEANLETASKSKARLKAELLTILCNESGII